MASPSITDQILGFLFGKKPLQQAAGTPAAAPAQPTSNPAYSQADMSKMAEDAAVRARAQAAPPVNVPPAKPSTAQKIGKQMTGPQ